MSDRHGDRDRAFKPAFEEALENGKGGDQISEDHVLKASVWLITLMRQ